MFGAESTQLDRVIPSVRLPKDSIQTGGVTLDSGRSRPFLVLYLSYRGSYVGVLD